VERRDGGTAGRVRTLFGKIVRGSSNVAEHVGNKAGIERETVDEGYPLAKAHSVSMQTGGRLISPGAKWAAIISCLFAFTVPDAVAGGVERSPVNDDAGVGASGIPEVVVTAPDLSTSLDLNFESGFETNIPVYKDPIRPKTPSDQKKDGPDQKGCSTMSNHPVIIQDGNKVLPETDFQTHHLNPIHLTRTYNHYNTATGIFGKNWTSNYDPSLFFTLSNGTSCGAVPGQTSSCVQPASSVTTVAAIASDGSTTSYTWNATDQRWENSSPDADDWFIRNADGSWTRNAKSGAVENYNVQGFVTSVANPTGIGMSFSYTSNYLTTATHSNGLSVHFNWFYGLLTSVVDPAGNTYSYEYNSNGYLSQAIYPNATGHARTYYYEDTRFPNALTGIAINGVRYSTYSYNSYGQVYQSGLSGGVEQLTFAYNGSTSTTITNAAGAVTTNSYSLIQGQYRLVSVGQSHVTGCRNVMATTFYDVYGHPSYSYDQNGNETTYTYSSNGLPQDVISGANRSGQQEETQYTWDTTKNRVTNIKTLGPNSSPIANTVYSYYPDSSPAKNRLQSVTVTNLTANGVPNQAQTTTYSYAFYASGIPSQIIVSGPLAGSKGYQASNYDGYGDLTSVSDVAGNTTTYSYTNTGLGLPSQVTDPNGAAIAYGYDALGRMVSMQPLHDGISPTTTFSYDGMNHLTQVKYPDLSWIQYGYDAAGRRTSIATSESASDKTTFTYSVLSTLSNVTIGVPGSTTYYSHSWTPDSVGRPLTEFGNHQQYIQYSYDGNGNLKTLTDSLGNVKTYTYTAHNQVSTVTDQYGTAGQNAVVTYTYDNPSHTATVLDAKGMTTSSSYDGFGHLIQLSSPDSGITTYSYDAQNRLTQMMRADGTITSYSYDNLNRIKQIQAGSAVKTYTYDTCTYGIGQLCSFSDSSGSTSYTYRQNGILASQTNVISGTSYTTSWSYDARDRVAGISYPGGNSVSYGYTGATALSKITSVNAVVNGVSQSVASNIQYYANTFGPLQQMTMGDGNTQTRTYDTDFRLTSMIAPTVQSWSYSYNANNDITTLTNNFESTLTETLQYNARRQLSYFATTSGSTSITFGPNGNRNGYYNGNYYTYDPYSNRISSISGTPSSTFGYDSPGNLLSDTRSAGSRTYGYDSFNRMSSFTNVTYGLTTSYTYNALDQRVRKAGLPGTYNYVYAPDGTLLGETSNGGTALTTQYIWFNGQPIGLIRNNVLYYISNDHLGRPHKVNAANMTQLWVVTNQPFDRTVTTDNIGGLNLGFPGQYYDTESMLYYNQHRYYDPATGRYIQSDPLGLNGGITTYEYAGGNPISFVDPLGLYCASTEDLATIHDMVAGAVVGAALDGIASKSWAGAAEGAVIGSAVSFVGDSFIQGLALSNSPAGAGFYGGFATALSGDKVRGIAGAAAGAAFNAFLPTVAGPVSQQMISDVGGGVAVGIGSGNAVLGGITAVANQLGSLASLAVQLGSDCGCGH